MAGEAALFDWAAYCELLLSEDEDAAAAGIVFIVHPRIAGSVAEFRPISGRVAALALRARRRWRRHTALALGSS